ncbi:hypothetical protein N0X72_15540 [Streptomyces carpaticus]|uniref:Formate-dependent nitrite reductase complex subunit NrfF n=1 Tax=Streptomyces carpaticus TaxID=285558 RepID=A0ABV4ZG49_9ACTN|nr:MULTISPECIES: hypothetical protein [Streptomyces]MCK1812932.1 hypothetical protein [Streptomyces sp. XM4011]UWM50310.1 hypothetical protein N0X72_15540 [Streptomyces carpaticus]
MWPRCRRLWRGALQVTVVRCAEGHVFAAPRFPLRQLRRDRIGPARLLRCPRCARLRSAVPVSDLGAVEVQV